ncbi:hypothetical protein GCM10010201_21280 [Pilimelia columellifera subsp. columellifera]|uniref:Uncharacterized protein n=1 Tax=Pilimelia columellifera subsp. columellifera TaxID=706583 RepID=A0ABN3NMG9_9ACTN
MTARGGERTCYSVGCSAIELTTQSPIIASKSQNRHGLPESVVTTDPLVVPARSVAGSPGRSELR